MERIAFKLIPLSEFSRDFPFSLRYRMGDDLRLVKSVQKHGLVQPLLATKDSPRRIVSGYLRFAAARQAGLKEVGVLEIPQKSSDQELFFLALISNCKNEWTELDRAWAVRRAVRDFRVSEDEAIEEVLPCLGLPSERHFFEEYLRIAELDPSLLDRVMEGELPFRGIAALTRFERNDQRAFAELIASQASLTTNQLLQAGEWLLDLLRSEKKGLREYLYKHLPKELFSEGHPDKRQRGEKFLIWLRELRYPNIVKREKKFAELASEIRRETETLSLEAPKFFEGEGFTLRTHIRRPESLDRALEIIRRKRSSLISFFEDVL